MLLQTSNKLERFVVIGFLLVILAGALMLWLFNNIFYGMPLSAVDSIFMSASAVCVTGLSPIVLNEAMGPVSQLIMLLLIQIGGLGIVTSMTFLAYVSGQRIGVKDRLFLMGGYGIDSIHGTVRFLRVTIAYTFLFELIGAAVLYFAFVLRGEAPLLSLWHAVFHSISAFCNAGFSTFPDGLESFYSSYAITGTIMTLIVLGGLGFPVYINLREHFREGVRISHYSRMVILTTLWLIILGTVFFLISDWHEGFWDMPPLLKIWNALFSSITTRTAGFSTVASSSFSGFGKAIMIILMIIGASPASTGGGVKTTTLGVIGVTVKNEILGRSDDSFWCRRISKKTERRALAILFLYICTLLIGTALLNITEKIPFDALLFEAVSAMGTVGLSVGITAEVSSAGKIILALMMFWGRVGILTFFATIIKAESGPEIHYAETDVLVG